MARNLLAAFTVLAFLAGCVSQPDDSPSVDPVGQSIASFSSSAEEGRLVFWASGCASCHRTTGSAAANQNGSKTPAEPELLLGGGMELKTAFGTFRTPNISPDITDGIGKWTKAQFFNAVKNGISPDGQNYFPAFPYTSYARMTDRDVANLWSFIQTLPPVSNKVKDHSISPLLKNRLAVGVWKKLYFKKGKAISIANASPQIARGQYLVEGPGHCGECHTPRNALGGLDYARWLAGGKAFEGDGYIPNITPDDSGLGGWSVADILASLQTTYTAATQSEARMADVRNNLAKLSVKDRTAIAEYLKAIPAVALPD